MKTLSNPLSRRLLRSSPLPFVIAGLLLSSCVFVTVEPPSDRDSPNETSASSLDASTPGETLTSSPTSSVSGPTGDDDTSKNVADSESSDPGSTTTETDTSSRSSQDNGTVTSEAASDTASDDSVSITREPTASSSTAASSDSTAGSSDAETTGNVPDSETTDSTTGTECPTEVADPSQGVFVSPFAVGPADTCGGLDEPCASIAVGIQRAISLGRHTVYLRQGSYAEQVTLDQPISLSGGWVLFQGAWQRECGQLAAYTTIQSPHATGLHAEFATEGTARIQALTIRTKGPDSQSDGESRYGIFARGVNTRLELADVTVAPGAANSGAQGAHGALLAAPPCTTGNGADGEPGATATPAASGTFTSNGYVPSSGNNGGNGTAGAGGANGATGSHSCTYCSVVNSTCQGVHGGVREAAGGTGGCGGPAGSGGQSGTGGGASIGLFTWYAQLELLSHVTVRAGDGGDAGAGGLGAVGGTGLPGTAGAEVACNSNVGANCPSVCHEKVRGGTGGKGGDGGSGADGSAGAGGSSFALVSTSGAVTGAEGADLSVGVPGASWGDSPTGLAQLHYSVTP